MHIGSIVLLAACAIASGCGEQNRRTASMEPGAPRRTNVLLISIDTLRADHLGTYGSPRATSPNIDALAADGRVFESARAVYPRTGPSVASMHIGAFPVKLHDWKIPKEATTLAEVLSEHGYETTAAVDNANLSRAHGYAQGFDNYRATWDDDQSEIVKTNIISDTAIEELRRLNGSAKPFFMWLHYVNPHGPYTPPPEYAAPFVGDLYYDAHALVPLKPFYPGDDAYVKTERRLAQYLANYDGEVAFADAEIGRVIAFLRTQPTFADTLIVITADHGESLGEWGLYFMHGPALDDANLRIPLIFYQKGQIGRARIKAPVLLIDVMPTILEWVNVESPATSRTPLGGESLVRLTARTLDSPHPYLFFASEDYWGVRAHDLQLNIQTRNKAQYKLPPVQLYDLHNDPALQRNLAASRPGDVKRLQKAIARRRNAQDELAQSPAERLQNLSKEELENLRSLGYIR